MSQWILFGLLIGIFLFSTTIVCWQIIMTLLEVRGILHIVRGMSQDFQPAIQDINDIIHKSNLAMDEANAAKEAAEASYKDAREKVNTLSTRAKHLFQSLSDGVKTGVQVFKESGDLESEFTFEEDEDELELIEA